MSGLTVWILVAAGLCAAAFLLTSGKGYDWRYDVGTILGWVGGVALFCGLIGAGYGALLRVECYQQSKAMGVRAEWGYMKGCIVFPGDGPGLPMDNYRGSEPIER